MKYTPHLKFLAIAALCGSLNAATTDPMGGMVIDCPAGGDTAIGLPFTRPVVFQGRVDSVSGNQITVDGDPSWSSDAFVYEDGVQDNHYYVLFSTGNKEGAWYTITANGSDTLTVDLNPYGLASPDSLADVATGGADVGDIIKIVPHWTPGTLVGVDGPDDLEILLYSNNIAGINLASNTSYQHYNSFGWYEGGTVVEDYILYPTEAFVLRNNGASAYELVFAGGVPMEQHRTVLRTINADVQQDNRITFNSPVPQMIGDANLGVADGTELLIFDNELALLNKSASTTLVYYAGFGWYDGGTRVDDPADPDNQFFLQPGESYILRKPAGPAEDIVWSAVQSYLD